MSAQVQHASILTGRQLVLGVTIALHAAAISGLMMWRITEAITEKAPGSIQVIDVVPDRLHEPPPPEKTRPIIQAIYNAPLERPDIGPIEEARQIVTASTNEVGPTDGGVGSAVPRDIVPPADTGLSYRATRASNDYYPSQAIRLAEEGIVIVRVCVDATGTQSMVPQVVKSSRSRLLDGAAVTWAREALQFTPATHAGAAIAACKEFRVNFTLH